MVKMMINFSHMPDTFFGKQKLTAISKAAVILSIMGERFNMTPGQVHTLEQGHPTGVEFAEASDAEWFFEHFWFGSPVTVLGIMPIKRTDRTDIWSKVRKLDPNDYLLVVNIDHIALEDRGFFIVVDREKALELKLSI